jgi:hypothetical protein
VVNVFRDLRVPRTLLRHRWLLRIACFPCPQGGLGGSPAEGLTEASYGTHKTTSWNVWSPI